MSLGVVGGGVGGGAQPHRILASSPSGRESVRGAGGCMEAVVHAVTRAVHV